MEPFPFPFPTVDITPLILFTVQHHPHTPLTMRYSAIVPVLAAGFVAAAPFEQRDVAMDFNPPPGGDVTILNYALTLEYLERKFYEEGLANYTQADFVAAGFADPFYDNLKEIYYDEQVSSP